MKPAWFSFAIALAVASSHGTTLLASAGAREPVTAARFGPGSCISTWVNGAGRCMVRTRCGEQDMTNYNVALLCVDDRGGVIRHEFGERSFDPEETFDTLINCHECDAPGSSFHASSNSAAKVLDQSLGSSGTQREIEHLKSLVGDLRRDMDKASDNINELNHMVSFPSTNASDASNGVSGSSEVTSFHVAVRVEADKPPTSDSQARPDFHAQRGFAHMPGAVLVPSGLETALHAQQQGEDASTQIASDGQSEEELSEDKSPEQPHQIGQRRLSPRRSTTELKTARARQSRSARLHSRAQRAKGPVAERAVEEMPEDAGAVEAGSDVVDTGVDADLDVGEGDVEVPVHKRHRHGVHGRHSAGQPTTKRSHPHGLRAHTKRLRGHRHHLANPKHTARGRHSRVLLAHEARDTDVNEDDNGVEEKTRDDKSVDNSIREDTDDNADTDDDGSQGF